MIVCENHPDADPQYHCPRCEKLFCRECITVKAFQKSALYMCKTCDHILTDRTPFRPVPPFWNRIPHILGYPFQDLGLFIMLLWPLFSVVIRSVTVIASWEAREYAPFWLGIEFKLIYFFFMFPLLYKVAESSAHGELSFFKISADSTIKDMLFAPVLEVAGPLIALLAPAVFLFMCFWSVHLWDPSAARIVLVYLFLFLLFSWLAFGLFIFPMSILIMSAFGRFLLVVNPLFVFSQARKINREYIRFFLITSLIFMVYFGLRTALVRFLVKDTMLSHFIFFAIDGWLHIYMAMVLGYMMGYMAYQGRFKLKWWSDTREEPTFTVNGELVGVSSLPVRKIRKTAAAAALGAVADGAGASAVNRKHGNDPMPADLELDIKVSELTGRGMYLIEHGNYEQAQELFKKLIAEHPDNFSVLQGLLMSSFRLQDYETVKAHANKLAAEFKRQHAFEALWDMYQDYQKALPDFRFRADELTALGRWLDDEGRHLEAARILRESAVLYPEDSRAAECLFQCGEILWKKCDKPENARNVFKAIIERYPDTEFSKKAGETLDELEKED